MPVLIIENEQKKVACSSCIRGHRASTCFHLDRVLIEVRKGGRPLNICPHPRGTCPGNCSQQPAYAIPGHAQQCACPGEPIREATVLAPDEARHASQRPDKARRKSKRSAETAMQSVFPSGPSQSSPPVEGLVKAALRQGSDNGESFEQYPHNLATSRPPPLQHSSSHSAFESTPAVKQSCCHSSQSTTQTNCIDRKPSSSAMEDPVIAKREPGSEGDSAMPKMSSFPHNTHSYGSSTIGPSLDLHGLQPQQLINHMNSLPTFNPYSSAYSYDVGQFHPTGFIPTVNPGQPLNAIPITNDHFRDNCRCGPDCQCLGCLSHYLQSTNPTMAHVQEAWQLQETEAYQRESQEQLLAYNEDLQQQYLERTYSTLPSQTQRLDERFFVPVYIPQNATSRCGHPAGLCKCGDGCLCNGCVLHTGHDNIPVNFEDLG